MFRQKIAFENSRIILHLVNLTRIPIHTISPTTHRAVFVVSVVLPLFVGFSSITYADSKPSIEDLKAGVVKITSTLDGKTRIGTGIIVNLEDDAAYIVTASHVIEGDADPNVTFFTDPNEAFTAKVIGLEGGDPKGLAALRVKDAPSSGLRVLRMDESATIYGGERVSLIGFPRVAGVPWAVTTGTIAGQKGSDLSFSGTADEGNSGGPLLIDGKVVGVVTQMSDQFGYASPTFTTKYALRGWGVRVNTVRRQRWIGSTPIPSASVDTNFEEVARLRRELEEAKEVGKAKAVEAARVQSELDAVRKREAEVERLREAVNALNTKRQETAPDVAPPKYQVDSIMKSHVQAAPVPVLQSELGANKKREAELERLRAELAELKTKRWEQTPDVAPVENQVDSVIASSTQAMQEVPIEEARVRPYDAPARMAKEITGKDGAPMVLVPAGPFMMRSNHGGAGEKPSHEVELNAFYIDKYEVTTSRYGKFFQATGMGNPKHWSEVSLVSQGDLPVVGVTWDDANDYCEAYGKRLSTEAEWQKAAFGTDSRTYPWGNEAPTDRHANFDKSTDATISGYQGLTAVGSYEAGVSPYGAYDMLGNVYEWVEEWYQENYNEQGPKRNLKDPYNRKYGVFLGGSLNSDSWNLQFPDRWRYQRSYKMHNVGFRCAKDAP